MVGKDMWLEAKVSARLATLRDAENLVQNGRAQPSVGELEANIEKLHDFVHVPAG